MHYKSCSQLRNDSAATHTNAVVCASYKQRECMDESDKDDDDDNDDGDDNQRSDSEEDLVLNDLDELKESGDSEIEENEDQPELFEQVILRSGLEDWPRVQNQSNKAIFLWNE